MNGGRSLDSDVNDPKYAAFYGPAQIQLQDGKDGDGSNLPNDWTYVSPAYANDWLARDAEIVQKYHPDIIFFDWWIGAAVCAALPGEICCLLLQRIAEARARWHHHLQVDRYAERLSSA